VYVLPAIAPATVVVDVHNGDHHHHDTDHDTAVNEARSTNVPAESRTGSTNLGSLALDLGSPVEWQAYADGFYVGIASGLGGTIELDAGAHSIELQADGFEPIRFAVRIQTGRTLTYRNTPTETTVPRNPRRADLRNATPRTLYIIPGCYAGDLPPAAISLPQGCDPSKAARIER
jgi:hypothetical protein